MNSGDLPNLKWIMNLLEAELLPKFSMPRPEPEWEDPSIARRRARMARRGRTLAQLMGAACLMLTVGCAAREKTSAELYPWTVTVPWACHLEDSCGIYPPYSPGAEYCGPPQIVCPGEKWINPTEAARTRGGVRYDGVGMNRNIACGAGDVGLWTVETCECGE